MISEQDRIRLALMQGKCPACGGSLKFGSHDDAEGVDYYWCLWGSDCPGDHVPYAFPAGFEVPGAYHGNGKEYAKIIDADTEQAARVQRGAAAAIDSTIFADVKPFDPKKAVSDIVGS